MDDLSISDFSDFEEILTPDEAESIEWNPQSPASAFAGQPPITHRERRHPPWSGHRDRLVGIVDMGRCVMNYASARTPSH
jgi:retrograde regulation protein 2